MFILTYQCVDSTHELEDEFQTVEEAIKYVDTQCGLLSWYSLTDSEGDEVRSSTNEH